MPFDSETQFGFKKVSPQEKLHNVFNVFKNVASKYDVMNDIMSFGLHHLWKRELVNLVSPVPGMTILDAASGTGDIAIRLHQACRQYVDKPKIVAYDQNSAMLDAGKTKAYNQGIFGDISWVEGDAAHLPFPDHHFDVITISFGLRNVTHMTQALTEFYRVLKPGGRFYCLEFSKPRNIALKKLYKIYSYHIIPKIGELIASNQAAYQYLVESIENFPDQKTLTTMLHEAGFCNVGFRNLTNGVVAIHSGCRNVIDQPVQA